ncbi:hypothetical protein TMatcc_002686 [Talaromyces marneffei ATCC 18224]
MTYLISLGLAGLALAASSGSCDLSKRAKFCGQWDSATDGKYIVYNDLWGESTATSGSQCSEIVSLSGNTLTWYTSWSWEGISYDVKSFANAEYVITPKQLSAISSIPTTWKWSYTGSNIVADVAYDMFTSSSASGSAQYEIMIWLAALGGAGPISSSGSTIATPTISFVAISEQTSYSGNLLDFFKYLEAHERLSSSQYLLTVQAGTEPFTGSGAELYSTYSVTVR